MNHEALHALGWEPTVGETVTTTYTHRLHWYSGITGKGTLASICAGKPYVVVKYPLDRHTARVLVRKLKGTRAAYAYLTDLVPWELRTR